MLRKGAWKPRVLMPVALLAVSAPALAIEYRGTIGTTIEHTDNALKSGQQERSELESSVWLALGLEHEGPQWQANVGYNLRRTYYEHDTQSDRSTIEGDAALHWEAIPQRGFLDISHSRRNVLQDSEFVDIRDNREDRDITRITPSYRFRVTSVDTLTASLNWTDVNYQRRSERDSDRYGGQLTWQRRLSPADSLLVDVGTSRIEFRSSLANDYRYDHATVGYSAQLSRLSYTVRAGVNRADRSGGDSSTSGGLLELTARYVSGQQSWQLDAGHRLTDSSMGNGNQALPDFDNYDGSFDRIDVITRSNAQLAWSWEGVCARCTLRVAAVYEREDYEQEPEDNTEVGVSTGLSYRLTSRSDLSFGYRYRDFSFHGSNTRSDYDLHEVSVRYSRRFGERLRLGLFLIDERRNSQDAGVDYDELRGGLTLSYDLL